MKIVITTSNRYHHLLPVFFYLYDKYWGAPCELVGYDKPDFPIPPDWRIESVKWYSMGVQGDKKDFSTDLRKYFEQLEDEYFIWLMEDTFIKAAVNEERLMCQFINMILNNKVGRMNLTDEGGKQDHIEHDLYYETTQTAKYRLSTQPSIWCKKFLLKYLTPGLSPWDFETQHPVNDGWKILGHKKPIIYHNEGVRRFNLHALNLDGMEQVDIDHIKTITDKW